MRQHVAIFHQNGILLQVLTGEPEPLAQAVGSFGENVIGIILPVPGDDPTPPVAAIPPLEELREDPNIEYVE